MKKVDFYWTENDGSQTIVFTLGMYEDGEIKVVGDKHDPTAEEILKNGIRGRMGKKFTKEDVNGNYLHYKRIAELEALLKCIFTQSSAMFTRTIRKGICSDILYVPKEKYRGKSATIIVWGGGKDNENDSKT